MTPQSISENATSDRIQLPFFFDVEKLQAEVAALSLGDFVYYDAIPLRAPAHLVDSSLPLPPPAIDFADGSWTDWLNTEALNKSPYLQEVIATFQQHTKVNLVRVLRLAPGAIVKEHTDPTLGLEEKKSMIRLTIPIRTNDQVQFFLNNEVVPMKLGECWYLRLTDRHRVLNEGPTERINLTIDVIPNEWMRSQIAGAVQG